MEGTCGTGKQEQKRELEPESNGGVCTDEDTKVLSKSIECTKDCEAEKSAIQINKLYSGDYKNVIGTIIMSGITDINGVFLDAMILTFNLPTGFSSNTQFTIEPTINTIICDHNNMIEIGKWTGPPRASRPLPTSATFIFTNNILTIKTKRPITDFLSPPNASDFGSFLTSNCCKPPGGVYKCSPEHFLVANDNVTEYRKTLDTFGRIQTFGGIFTIKMVDGTNNKEETFQLYSGAQPLLGFGILQVPEVNLVGVTSSTIKVSWMPVSGATFYYATCDKTTNMTSIRGVDKYLREITFKDLPSLTECIINVYALCGDVKTAPRNYVFKTS